MRGEKLIHIKEILQENSLYGCKVKIKSLQQKKKLAAFNMNAIL